MQQKYKVKRLLANESRKPVFDWEVELKELRVFRENSKSREKCASPIKSWDWELLDETQKKRTRIRIFWK